MNEKYILYDYTDKCLASINVYDNYYEAQDSMIGNHCITILMIEVPDDN